VQGPPLSDWARPRALRAGDLVGVCAPAGPVDPPALDQGIAELESLGFRVRRAEGILERHGFTAGPVATRLAGLRGLFADDEVKGIFCARGGAGAGGLLPHLDADWFRARPKVFVGYSDITLLHLFLNRLGLVSFHGPMVAKDLAARTYDRDSLQWAITGEGQLYRSDAEDLLPLRGGTAEGRLRGGCLSLLAAAAGTPWALDTAGEDTILFVEDVDEPPYRIDRLLRQLRYSGALSGVRGIVFGDMKGCSPRLDADYTLEDVVKEALEGLDIPLALGLSSGHSTGRNVTLPLGVRARLSCAAGGDEARFEILETPVS
jgi:muramoyltetrapeptide carboxypeptidase